MAEVWHITSFDFELLQVEPSLWIHYHFDIELFLFKGM